MPQDQVPERRFEIDNLQVVTVDHHYSYLWDGAPPLKVGDHVQLPGAFNAPPWAGTVTALGSTHHGVHKYVMHKLPR